MTYQIWYRTFKYKNLLVLQMISLPSGKNIQFRLTKMIKSYTVFRSTEKGMTKKNQRPLRIKKNESKIHSSQHEIALCRGIQREREENISRDYIQMCLKIYVQK